MNDDPAGGDQSSKTSRIPVKNPHSKKTKRCNSKSGTIQRENLTASTIGTPPRKDSRRPADALSSSKKSPLFRQSPSGQGGLRQYPRPHCCITPTSTPISNFTSSPTVAKNDSSTFGARRKVFQSPQLKKKMKASPGRKYVTNETVECSTKQQETSGRNKNRKSFPNSRKVTKKQKPTEFLWSSTPKPDLHVPPMSLFHLETLKESPIVPSDQRKTDLLMTSMVDKLFTEYRTYQEVDESPAAKLEASKLPWKKTSTEDENNISTRNKTSFLKPAKLKLTRGADNRLQAEIDGGEMEKSVEINGRMEAVRQGEDKEVHDKSNIEVNKELVKQNHENCETKNDEEIMCKNIIDISAANDQDIAETGDEKIAKIRDGGITLKDQDPPHREINKQGEIETPQVEDGNVTQDVSSRTKPDILIKTSPDPTRPGEVKQQEPDILVESRNYRRRHVYQWDILRAIEASQAALVEKIRLCTQLEESLLWLKDSKVE